VLSKKPNASLIRQSYINNMYKNIWFGCSNEFMTPYNTITNQFTKFLCLLPAKKTGWNSNIQHSISLLINDLLFGIKKRLRWEKKSVILWNINVDVHNPLYHQSHNLLLHQWCNSPSINYCNSISYVWLYIGGIMYWKQDKIKENNSFPSSLNLFSTFLHTYSW
jgi:hypothetical protein